MKHCGFFDLLIMNINIFSSVELAAVIPFNRETFLSRKLPFWERLILIDLLLSWIKYYNDYFRHKTSHLILETSILSTVHCVKSVQIRSFSGPYFPVFRLDTNIYYLRIQSEYRKIRITKSSVFGHFPCSGFA